MTLPTCHHCAAPAAVFSAGTEPEEAPGGIVVRRGAPIRGLCLPCAVAVGWLLAPPKSTGNGSGDSLLLRQDAGMMSGLDAEPGDATNAARRLTTQGDGGRHT